jgi:predicted nucleic acid-binding protein
MTLKKSVYLDATIFSYLVDDRDEIKNFIEITKLWWKVERKHYKVCTSSETIIELDSGNYPGRNLAIRQVKKIDLLQRNNEIQQIAEIYIANYLMPDNLLGDAIHLAYASYYKIDFLLTWNCKHLANANKREHIRITNSRLNLIVPEIITPLELFM